MADFIDFYNHRRHHEGLDKRDAGGCLLRAAHLQPTPSQLSVAQALPMRQWLQIAASMGLENGPRRRPGRAGSSLKQERGGLLGMPNSHAPAAPRSPFATTACSISWRRAPQFESYFELL